MFVCNLVYHKASSTHAFCCLHLTQLLMVLILGGFGGTELLTWQFFVWPHAPCLFPWLQDPPYFTVLPGWEYRQEAGRELLIPCAAAGDPFPIIAWRKVPGLPDKSAVPLAFGEYCRQRSHTLSR